MKNIVSSLRLEILPFSRTSITFRGPSILVLLECLVRNFLVNIIDIRNLWSPGQTAYTGWKEFANPKKVRFLNVALSGPSGKLLIKLNH
jgi:hypothetical protein